MKEIELLKKEFAVGTVGRRWIDEIELAYAEVLEALIKIHNLTNANDKDGTKVIKISEVARKTIDKLHPNNAWVEHMDAHYEAIKALMQKII